MGQQWKCFCIICWYRKSPEKNRVRGQCDGVGGWYSTNDRPLQQWTCLRESRKLSRSIWVWQNKKIAGSRRQVTGTIQTINQYSFIKLMVMVGMSIIVLVRRRKAGWRGPTLFHLLDGKFLWNRRRSNLKHHHRRNGTKLWPNVTITLSGKPAEKVPEVQGRYKKQNMIWQGHHVYKQSNGLYLYVDWGWNSWAVGSELGGIRKLIGKV